MYRKAYALATVLVLLGVSLFGVGAVVAISGLETKIARSQLEGTTAYYAADAGITDAIWRLNNDTAYKNALLAGTLNVTYSATNAPQTGQGFIVTMVTSSQGAGYADVTVDATSDNGTFVARRKVAASVFGGVATSPIGEKAVMAGGSLSISNGASSVNVTNGDIFARGNISISQATVNTASNWIRTAGTYSAHSASVTTAGIAASNYPPAPAADSVPGVDFPYYQANNNASYTATQFMDLIDTNPNLVLPGPVTYVQGNVSLRNNNASGSNLTINGLLVVNGSFTIQNSVKNISMTVTDPGDGRSGILINGGGSFSSGNISVSGVIYASGSLSFTSLPAFTVDGAVVAGGTVSLTSSGNLNVTFASSRVISVFGSGGINPQAVQVQHWEEKY